MYYKLNREEKKIIRDKYKKTKRGSNNINLYNKLILDAFFCLFCAIAITISIILDKVSVWFYSLVVVLMLGFFVFIISQYVLKIKEYNKFMEQSKK